MQISKTIRPVIHLMLYLFFKILTVNSSIIQLSRSLQYFTKGKIDMENVFESTSRERIMKSIKLELKPHPMTKKAMEEHKVMDANRAFIRAEETLQPAIDFVVKKIIAGALDTCHEDFAVLYSLKLEAKESDAAAKKYADAREKTIHAIQKAISAYKLNGLNSYKDIGSADFLKNGFPELIKNASTDEISTEEKIEWLETLQGFQSTSTLLSKFVTSRISILENKCPKRVLENFDIFVDNMAKISPFLATSDAKEFLIAFPECISFTDPSYYEICMTPEGIESYNHVISGICSPDGTETKGYNQFINELNQKHRSTNSYQGPMFRTLKPLNQQILFPKKSAFKIEQMTCEDDVRKALRLVMETMEKKKLFSMIASINTASADGLVLNGSELHQLSHIVFGKHNVIPDLVMEEVSIRMEDELNSTNRNLENTTADEKAQIKQLKEKLKEYKQQHKAEKDIENYKVELDTLTSSVNEEIKRVKEHFKVQKKTLKQKIKELQDALDRISLTVAAKTFTLQEITDYCSVKQDTSKNIFDEYIGHLKYLYTNISKGLANIMDSNILTDGSIRFYTDNKIKVKEYLDSLLDFRNAVNIIYTSGNDDRKNILLYNELDAACEVFAPLTKIYNQIRNFLVSKAGDFAKEEKVFFGTPVKLASGWWSGERFIAKTETIILMNGKYYYVTRGFGQKNFDFYIVENDDPSEYYEVLSQKSSQDAGKQIPKSVFNKECRQFFETNPEESEFVHTEWLAPLKVTREQYQIYKEKLFSVSALKSGAVSPDAFRRNLNSMINLYKEFCNCYNHYVRFTFTFRPSEEYADLGEFFSEANTCMLDAEMLKVSKSQIDSLISSGQLYAFLVCNQSMYKKGGLDPYADIFLNLMSPENMKTGKMRLNAKPNITYRPACIPKKITHPVGSVLVNKRTRSGKSIPSETYLQIYNNLNGKMSDNKLSKEAKQLLTSGEIVSKISDKNLIKDERYTENKFFISFSYVQNNRVSDRKINTITEDVKRHIEENGGVRTLSVVRGVNHLLYYILFDRDRKTILKEGNLNTLNGMDYGQKLKELSATKQSGKSDDWNYTISSKGVKDFYLHVAIGEICKLAYENQAIICIENVTPGFKDKMSALDNQIFAKFETMLEDRLRDLKFPKVPKGKPGSVTDPLQLTKTTIGNPMQNGILFKVNPAYTATICPDSGFVNLFNFNAMQTVRSQKEFLQSFDSIYYNPNTKLFELTFDYTNFQNIKKKPEQKTWKIFVGKDIYISVGKSMVQLSEKTRELVQSLTENQLIDKDLSKEDMPTSIRKEMFMLIKNTLCKTAVKLDKKGEENYFCSPALEEDKKYTQSHLKAYNLAKKLWFTMDHMEDGKSQYTTADDWLKHYFD